MESLKIFGGTGFIGSHFHALYPETHVVPRENKEFQAGDALYLISTTNNYNVFNDPTLDVRVNLVRLMGDLPRIGGTFNYVSTINCVGDRGMHDIREDTVCNPRGFYPITKLCAEQLTKSYCSTFNHNYRILRLSNVIGKNPSTSSKNNALEFLLAKIKRGEDISVYEGDNYRNYLDIEDCCRAIKLVLEKGNLNDTYNIGSIQSHRIYDIVHYAIWKTKSSSKIKIVPVPDFHKKVQAPNFFMNTDKLQALGFVQKYNLEETINRALA